MTLEIDVATYLGTTGGANIGITLASTSGGTAPLIYEAPFPTGSADYAACVIPYAGLPSVRGMGASLSTPLAEVTRFQVVVRHDEDHYVTARAKSESVASALDHLAEATLGATRYLYVKTLAPNVYIGPDGNGRHRFAVNCEAMKERG